MVADPGKPIPPIEVSTAKEPTSHKSTTWLAEHRYQFDATCAQCHTVDNPGGKDNSSFCSNSACHATEWVYAGLDAPKVRQLSAPPKVPGTGAPEPDPAPGGSAHRLPDLSRGGQGEAVPREPRQLQDRHVHAVPQAHAARDGRARRSAYRCAHCDACRCTDRSFGCWHCGPSPTAASSAATATPATTTAATATPQATATSASAGGPPAIPHAIDDPVHKDCTLCHGEGKTKPFPANHTAFAVDSCAACHKPAQQPAAGDAATAVPTATVAAVATTATTAPTIAAATPTPAAASAHRSHVAATAAAASAVQGDPARVGGPRQLPDVPQPGRRREACAEGSCGANERAVPGLSQTGELKRLVARKGPQKRQPAPHRGAGCRLTRMRHRCYLATW